MNFKIVNILNSCRASVAKRFLLIFLLGFATLSISCGIPNYFYLGSNYINVQSTVLTDDTKTEKTIRVSFQIADRIQLVKCTRCPSIALFYLLDNDSVVYNANKSTIFSNFISQLGAESNKGSIFSIEPGTVTEVIKKFTPSNDQSIKVSIYPFAFKGGAEVSRPGYHVSIPVDADGRPSTDTIDFLLTFDYVSHTLKLRYSPKPNGFDDPDSVEIELIRTDGVEDFAGIVNAADFDAYKNRNADLDAIKDSSLIKLRVLGAMCASEGYFDNIYWSRLHDLGVFDIT